MSAVELEHVTVSRSGVVLLDDVSLTIGDGELLGVVGASGAGKTTLLRAIAGLEPLSAGTIRIGGIDAAEQPAARRDVSMVFQSSVLLPHRDVRGNIAFPLQLRRRPAEEIAARVTAETRALHIEALLARSPAQLSAGETQLVQVARAMVRSPSLLLLDEPLAHLDVPLALHLRQDLRTLQLGYGVTTLLATNDPTEAMALPDRLVVLRSGRVVQVGAPMDVYRQPANLMAAACTGEMSTFTVRVEADSSGFWLVHPSFRHRAWRPLLAAHVGSSVVAGVRPAWVRIAADGPVVATVETASAVTRTVIVSLGGGDRVEIATGSHVHRPGERVSLHLDEVALFDPLTGDRLGP